MKTSKRIDLKEIDCQGLEDKLEGEIDQVISNLREIKEKVQALGYDTAVIELEAVDEGYYESHFVVRAEIIAIK